MHCLDRDVKGRVDCKGIYVKVATPVDASRNNGLLLVEEFSINAHCKYFIKEDFLVPTIPYMMVLVGGFGRGFLK